MTPRSTALLCALAVGFGAVSPCSADEPPAPEDSTDALPPLPAAPTPTDLPAPDPTATPVPTLPAPIAPPEASERRPASTWSRDTSLGALGTGAGALGVGWILAVLHGALGEMAGVDCKISNGSYTDTFSCTDTDDYRGIYVPVAGPFLEAANHKGTLSDTEKGFLAVEGVLQAGGAAFIVLGLSTLPMTHSKPARTAGLLPAQQSPRLTIAPVVSAHDAGLAITGTF